VGKYDYIFFDYRNKTLDDYEELDEATAAAKKLVGQYIDNLAQAVGSADGLTFIGPPGTGKTLLASIILRACADADYSVDAIAMSDFVALFHDQFRIGRDLAIVKDALSEVDFDRYNAVNERLYDLRCHTKVVLFDDVGKEYDSGSGWSNSQFDRFLRTRRNLGLTTLITSNTAVSQWSKRYSESMESFLSQITTVLVFSEKIDRRRGRRAGWKPQ
jgi:DNA replication protein DnaC